jgi:hypothetical protein
MDGEIPMPRVKFTTAVSLPFGGEGRFFKADTWYTIGSAHLTLLKRNNTLFQEEGAEQPPPPPEAEPYDSEILAAIHLLIDNGDPDNFHADGTPTNEALEQQLGSSITNEQRLLHWDYVLSH